MSSAKSTHGKKRASDPFHPLLSPDENKGDGDDKRKDGDGDFAMMPAVGEAERNQRAVDRQIMYGLGEFGKWMPFNTQYALWMFRFAQAVPAIEQCIMRIQEKVCGRGIVLYEERPVFKSKHKQRAFHDHINREWFPEFIFPGLYQLLTGGLLVCSYVPDPDYGARPVIMDLDSIVLYYRFNAMGKVMWRVRKRSRSFGPRGGPVTGFAVQNWGHMTVHAGGGGGGASAMSGALNTAESIPLNSFDEKYHAPDFKFVHPEEPRVYTYSPPELSSGCVITPLASLVRDQLFLEQVRAAYLDVLNIHRVQTRVISRDSKPPEKTETLYGMSALAANVPGCDALTGQPLSREQQNERMQQSNLQQAFNALMDLGKSQDQARSILQNRDGDGRGDRGGGGPGDPSREIRLKDGEKLQRSDALPPLPDIITPEQSIADKVAQVYGVSTALTSKQTVGKSLISGGSTKTTDAPMDMFKTTCLHYGKKIGSVFFGTFVDMFTRQDEYTREQEEYKIWKEREDRRRDREYAQKQRQLYPSSSSSSSSMRIAPTGNFTTKLVLEGGNVVGFQDAFGEEKTAPKPPSEADSGDSDSSGSDSDSDSDEDEPRSKKSKTDANKPYESTVSINMAGVTTMEEVKTAYESGQLKEELWPEYLSAHTGIPIGHMNEEAKPPKEMEQRVNSMAKSEGKLTEEKEKGKLKAQRSVGIDITKKKGKPPSSGKRKR